MTLRRALATVAGLLAAGTICGCSSSGGTIEQPPARIDLATDYNRQAQQLLVEIVHSNNASVNVNFITPEWISLLINSSRELPDGRLLMDLSIDFNSAEVNTADIKVIATDDAGTRNSVDVPVSRPIFIAGHQIDATADGVTLTVSVDAPVDNAVSLIINPSTDFVAVPVAEQSGTGSGDYTFQLEYAPLTYLAGAAGVGEVHIRADDDIGHSVFDYVEFTFDRPALAVPAGTLAAVPLRSEVKVNQPVTIAVVTGELPTSAPLYNLSAVALTFAGDVHYLWPSFNSGLPGGGHLDPDGIWTAIAPSGLTTSWEDAPNPHRVELPDGLYRMDFDLAPTGGSATTDGGVLFTFDVVFSEPGEVRCGFQSFEYISRTHYTDASGAEHHWADVSNNYANVPNTLFVVE